MKVLAISLAYPPLAYPRSVQVARLLKHANASTVLFCADEQGARLDETIEPDAEADLEACIRVPVVQNRLTDFTDRISHRLVRSLWNRRNLLPDRYVRWKKTVLDEVHDFIEKNDYRPDVLVTFAQPFTDHLIGLSLKMKYGFPWFAHFSDPWVDNPFTPFDEYTLGLNRTFEKMVTEKADVLAFTSAETVDLFFSKYPLSLRKKACVLSHCFGHIDRLIGASSTQGPVIIRYLGNFYGRRTPEPLIAGLIELFNQDPVTVENVTFELIGPGDAAEVRALSAKLPEGLITSRPSVKYRESIELMSSADGLLVIDAPADVSVFLPSKLIDYAGVARPIFGITPEGSAAVLIRRLGGRVANPADTRAVTSELAEFIRKLRERRLHPENEPWGESEVRNSYSAPRIAEEFTKMLRELVSNENVI